MIRLASGLALATLVALSGPQPLHAHGPHGHAHPARGPAGDYAFALAAPGSYALPAIKPATGGVVLDELGVSHDLAELLAGRIALLAFIYTRCGDVCPMASLRMAELRDLAAGDPHVMRQVRLVSMSFDPDYDTPGRIAEHGALWRDPGLAAPEWLFVTAPDQAHLAPVLDACGQTLAPKLDKNDPTGHLSHVLRVFLVDRVGLIRNIYSLEFLDAELVLNDIVTLLMDEERERAQLPSSLTTPE